MKRILFFVLVSVSLFSLSLDAKWTDRFQSGKGVSGGGAEAGQGATKVIPYAGAPESFHLLVEGVSNTVVNISTTKKVKVRPFNPFKDFGPSPFGSEDPFKDFFDKFFDAPEMIRPERSLGSGFLFKPDGYILTNNHVVAGADEIIVTLADERKYKAKVVGTDEDTDIAVIKINAPSPLPYATLGDSDELNIGDWVVAIGNPFGLSHTVTAGIVSAKGRVIGAGKYDNFIQTDASINPGNSGGPLFNMKGEVVGINTAIFAAGQGLGFAIPINMAKKFLPQLMEFGKVKDRGWLGVGVQELTPELAKSLGLSENQTGVLINQVFPDSPASKAGIKRGDVITKFNGTEIKKYNELPGLVASVQPGTEAEVTILRKGEEKTVKVVLGNREASKEVASAGEEEETPSQKGAADKLGLVVRGVKPEEASKLGIEQGRGVVVERVEPGSAAEDADVRSGDVILEINEMEIDGIKAYQAALAKISKGDIVRLLIRRSFGTIYLAFTLQ